MANARGFTIFETGIGRCGIAWSDAGVAGVQLPEVRAPQTRARLLGRFPQAREKPPPPAVRRAIDGIAALLRGEPSDLSAVALDMSRVPDFPRRVYEFARTIPRGATLSYGEVAARIGAPGAARAVGRALGRNPFAIVVPCHRVLAAGGKAGGFSASGGVSTKLRLLSIEGARATGAEPVFDGDGALGFDPQAAVAQLRASDGALSRWIDSAGPFRLRLKSAPTTFGALAEAIVYQQLTGEAAATIFARVCALFPRGHRGPTPGGVARLSDEVLLGAGLSRSKLLSLRDLANRAERRQVPTLAEAGRMTDEEIVERLIAVRGIGRWTAEMFLIFRLGRPDVLPVDDYGLRKGFAAVFGKGTLPTREELERRAARWRPYRSVASWYLWRAAERAGR